MIVHDGIQTPNFEVHWDTSDIEYVWVSWSEKLQGSKIILSSSWTLPDGWIGKGEQINETVEEDSIQYLNCNGILLNPNIAVAEYIYKISNAVTLSDGSAFERSFYIILGEL